MSVRYSRLRLFAVAFVLLVCVAFVGGGKVAPSGEASQRFVTRCGWFVNPTPANAWLEDKDGEWIIGVQGGHQAEGDWPDFKPEEWVETNVHYGYGCACMQVKANSKTRRVLEIKQARSRPLSVCRKDKALKEPG